MDQSDLIQSFLNQNGWGKAIYEAHLSDASARKYYRLRLGHETRILMDSPQSENPGPWVVVNNLLRTQELSAPIIYAADIHNGLILMEDFGDRSYASVLNRGADPEPLYMNAVDVLLQTRRIKDLKNIPPYSIEQMLTEVETFTDWAVSVPDKAKTEFLDIWKQLIPIANQSEQGFIIWDYHVNNIMLLDRPGFQSCGLLDFQDARIAPFAYDLMALVEDARRAMSSDLKEKLLQKYIAEAPVKEIGAFMKSYHILAMQRHMRVLGFFIRYYKRDGRTNYLPFVPHIWELLQSHLDQPVLRDLTAWLDRYVPMESRGAP